MKDTLADSDTHSSPYVELPSWAVVGPKRRAHIGRVTALLSAWAAGMRLDPAKANEWIDAGRLHDALLFEGLSARDAIEQLMMREPKPEQG